MCLAAWCFSLVEYLLRLIILALSHLYKETERFLSLVRGQNHVLMEHYILIFRETIGTLIDNGKSLEKRTEELSESLAHARLSETLYFHQAFRCFWLGYSERCNHYINKLLDMDQAGRHHRLIIIFYQGVNAARMLRRRPRRFKPVVINAIRALKEAARLSRWNYGSKVHLLKAELYSWEKNNQSASASYAAAIIGSRSSHFVVSIKVILSS